MHLKTLAPNMNSRWFTGDHITATELFPMLVLDLQTRSITAEECIFHGIKWKPNGITVIYYIIPQV